MKTFKVLVYTFFIIGGLIFFLTRNSSCGPQCREKKEFKKLSFDAIVDTFYYDWENHATKVIEYHDRATSTPHRLVLLKTDSCFLFWNINVSDHIIKNNGQDYIVRVNDHSNDTFCVQFFCNEN